MGLHVAMEAHEGRRRNKVDLGSIQNGSLVAVMDGVRRYLMVLRRVPEFKYEIGLQSKP
jgi:hypothetical protein